MTPASSDSAGAPALVIGLTGGIGSGKSTVARLLVEHGAALVDADQIAREVVEPGRPAHRALLQRFGTDIVTADGTIDRPALAARVFGDPVALADLNAITHPVIGAELLARRNAAAARGGVVVVDIPLLRDEHRRALELALVVVVDAPTEVAVERLVSQRGMDRTDAEARVAAQADRATRLAQADIVVDNVASPEDLRQRVDQLWSDLAARLALTATPPGR
ncbi:MAG: dephospho-CoA kinase [Actinomycetota bacterium]|nr:dephospho-CoA kinase [Actinomycetota bacterium]